MLLSLPTLRGSPLGRGEPLGGVREDGGLGANRPWTGLTALCPRSHIGVLRSLGTAEAPRQADQTSPLSRDRKQQHGPGSKGASGQPAPRGHRGSCPASGAGGVSRPCPPVRLRPSVLMQGGPRGAGTGLPGQLLELCLAGCGRGGRCGPGTGTRRPASPGISRATSGRAVWLLRFPGAEAPWHQPGGRGLRPRELPGPGPGRRPWGRGGEEAQLSVRGLDPGLAWKPPCSYL